MGSIRFDDPSARVGDPCAYCTEKNRREHGTFVRKVKMPNGIQVCRHCDSPDKPKAGSG